MGRGPAQSGIAWGIGDIAEEQFRTDCDQFCVVGHGKDLQIANTDPGAGAPEPGADSLRPGDKIK